MILWTLGTMITMEMAQTVESQINKLYREINNKIKTTKGLQVILDLTKMICNQTPK